MLAGKLTFLADYWPRRSGLCGSGAGFSEGGERSVSGFRETKRWGEGGERCKHRWNGLGWGEDVQLVGRMSDYGNIGCSGRRWKFWAWGRLREDWRR